MSVSCNSIYRQHWSPATLSTVVDYSRWRHQKS